MKRTTPSKIEAAKAYKRWQKLKGVKPVLGLKHSKPKRVKGPHLPPLDEWLQLGRIKSALASYRRPPPRADGIEWYSVDEDFNERLSVARAATFDMIESALLRGDHDFFRRLASSLRDESNKKIHQMPSVGDFRECAILAAAQSGKLNLSKLARDLNADIRDLRRRKSKLFKGK